MLSPFFYANHSSLSNQFFKIFPLFNDVYFKHTLHYKKDTIKELKNFIFKNHYRWTGFPNRNSYYSMKYNKEKYLPFFAAKLLEKIPDVLMVSNTTKLLIALY